MSNQDLAELYGGPLDSRTSMFSHLENGLTKHTNGVASIIMHQPADHLHELTKGADSLKTVALSGCLSWTYSQLHQAAMRLTAALQAQGVRPGMKIATMISNRIEYHILLWMCQILRLDLCLLDPGAVTPPRREELATLMDLIQPDIVVVLNEEGIEAVDSLARSRDIKMPISKVVLEAPKDAHPAWHTIQSLTSASEDVSAVEQHLLPAARIYDTERLFSLLFTSGTSTGQPKGCPRTVHNTASFLENPQWNYDDKIPCRRLTNSANFRAIAPTLAVDTWKLGGTLVMTDPTSGVKGIIAAIREHKVTILPLLPATVHSLTADPEFQDLDTSCVLSVTLSGDVITRDLFMKTCHAFPNANVSTRHGMTEAQSVVDWPFNNTPPQDIPFYNDISPIGTVMRGARIRIRDPETGTTVHRNEPAELVVSCAAAIDHYLNDQNPEAFFIDSETGEQWFRTGDLAMINSDGVVYILGRIKDVIKRAGVPITPAALENCVANFTGSSSCVVAWPDEVLGQEPLAVVEDLKGRTKEDVKEEVLRKFGKDYAMGPVLELRELGMGGFPLNASGKIMKGEVLGTVERFLGGEVDGSRT